MQGLHKDEFYKESIKMNTRNPLRLHLGVRTPLRWIQGDEYKDYI